MRLDKICRTCLTETTSLKPIFGACVPNMLMTCASVQIVEGDGLPDHICTQCLQMVSKSYSFKQLCEKSDVTLRQYINSISFHNVSIQNNEEIMVQQTSIFSDIFNDATTHSLVENFSSHNNATEVVSDLADTMESLQTIAEQCLSETWESEAQLVADNVSQESCGNLTINTIYKCQFCEEIFKDEWTLVEHIKIHTGQARYFYSVFSKDCNTPLESNKLNGSEKSVEEKTKILPKFYNCNLCNKSYHDLRLLKRHYRDSHSSEHSFAEKGFICKICGKRYQQNKLLIVHMRSHTGERPLSCEVCGKTFSLPSSLHKHRTVHTGEKKHKCNICLKAFNQISNLRTHIRTHTGEKPYICSVCDKACATKVNLRMHMRTHTGEKPHKCSRCESAFTTGSMLKKHMMRHTGEKPYKCWQCNKSFRQKDTRDTHVRYHTGERPYACHFCPKKYIAASHLRVHVKSHTGEKRYECNICSKKFAHLRTLKVHLIAHTGQKPYQCHICSNHFSQSGSLATHIKNCHEKSTYG